jgi:hypothetical protein
MHHPARVTSPRQIPRQEAEPLPLYDEAFSSWAEWTERLVLSRTRAAVDAFILVGVLIIFAAGAIAHSGSAGDGAASRLRTPFLAEFQSPVPCQAPKLAEAPTLARSPDTTWRQS